MSREPNLPIDPHVFADMVRVRLPPEMLEHFHYEPTSDVAVYGPRVGVNLFWKQLKTSHYCGGGLYGVGTWAEQATKVAKRLVQLRRGYPIGHVIKDELTPSEAYEIADSFLKQYKGQKDEIINSRALIEAAVAANQAHEQLQTTYDGLRGLFGASDYGVQMYCMGGSQRKFDIYRAYRDLARHVKRRLNPEPDAMAPVIDKSEYSPSDSLAPVIKRT